MVALRWDYTYPYKTNTTTNPTPQIIKFIEIVAKKDERASIALLTPSHDVLHGDWIKPWLNRALDDTSCYCRVAKVEKAQGKVHRTLKTIDKEARYVYAAEPSDAAEDFFLIIFLRPIGIEDL
jgi:hypothetical protein